MPPHARALGSPVLSFRHHWILARVHLLLLVCRLGSPPLLLRLLPSVRPRALIHQHPLSPAVLRRLWPPPCAHPSAPIVLYPPPLPPPPRLPLHHLAPWPVSIRVEIRVIALPFRSHQLCPEYIVPSSFACCLPRACTYTPLARSSRSLRVWRRLVSSGARIQTNVDYCGEDVTWAIFFVVVCSKSLDGKATRLVGRRGARPRRVSPCVCVAPERIRLPMDDGGGYVHYNYNVQPRDRGTGLHPWPRQPG